MGEAEAEIEEASPAVALVVGLGIEAAEAAVEVSLHISSYYAVIC